MLGNDVVDLIDVDARPETFQSRFDARVFAPAERERIARDAASPSRGASPSGSVPIRFGVNPQPQPHPHALRWAHWAAKEAAYKAMRQRDPHFVFSPIRLVASFDAPGTGRLPGSTRRGRLEVAGPASVVLELTSFETSDFVHVLALGEGGDWGRVVWAVERLGEPRAASPSASPSASLPEPSTGRSGSSDSSAAVRRLALREIARARGVAPARLAIGRHGRIPTLELDGRTASVALSLSHHGRFVAFAAATATATAAAAAPAATADEDGALRNELGDGHVAQRIGVVGAPARRADAERMAG